MVKKSLRAVVVTLAVTLVQTVQVVWIDHALTQLLLNLKLDAVAKEAAELGSTTTTKTRVATRKFKLKSEAN